MQIPLNQFEQYINETILSRGLSYFRNNHVHEPEELSPGVYEFMVEGSKDYTVRIKISNDVITEFVCDCPYDMGPICKHVAAAIFFLLKEELSLTNKKKVARRKKRKTKADQVNELLESVSHEDLKEFIRENAAQDRHFRNFFLTSFAHLNANESKAAYEKQVKGILKAASDRHGFIDWSVTGQVSAAIEKLLTISQKQVELKNYKSAFLICSAITEQMTEALQYADDSNGDFGYCIDAAFEILSRLAQENTDEKMRTEVLDYCFKAFEDNVYAGWDWHIVVLYIAGSLIKTEQEANRIFTLIDGIHSEYDKEMAQNIKYELLQKIKGENEAEEYLEKNINNPELRRQAIAKAIDHKDFGKANKLAKQGIAYDMKDKPGLAKEWYDWLLKSAQAQGNQEKIIEYARYLLIDNFHNEQDYYLILKNHVNPEVWKEFIEGVIGEISKRKRWTDPDLIANLYIREKWWDRLMEMLRKEPSLLNIEIYEEYLKENHANELIDLYSTAILDYLENKTGRKHYQTAARYLRRMIKLGGRDKSNKIISGLRERYPKRRALMEELDNV